MEKISQIYDKIFKRIITLSSPAIIRFINTVFEKDFELDSEITYNWTESVDDELDKTIADTIITINDIFKFHTEVQITDDNSMALRMFEYEFREALKYKEIEDNKVVLSLPEARIIYLEHTENTPEYVDIVFYFQGQGVFEYRIKAEMLLRYSVDDLNNSGMIILMPLYLLKLRKKIVKSYKKKPVELAAELKMLIESCIISIEANKEKGNITLADTDILINLLSRLYNQLYADYEVFKEEGVDSMITGGIVTYGEQRVIERTIELAKKMLKRGLSIIDVAEDTGLDESTIRQLQSELTS